MKEKITIEYCTSWGYVGRAVALTRKLLNEFKNDLKEVSLIPSSGGVYEISFEDELIYSKKETGEYPDDSNLVEIVRGKLK